MNMPTLRFVNHLRGRVTGPVRHSSNGNPIWRVEVINTRTGKCVDGGDDAYSLTDALEDALERAYIARVAWFYSLRKKDLK
jgi:hypothetical protein